MFSSVLFVRISIYVETDGGVSAWCSMVCRRKDLFVDESLRAHFCANRTAQDGFSDTVNGGCEMSWDCEGRNRNHSRNSPSNPQGDVSETVSTLEAQERSFDQPESCSNVALAMNVTQIDHLLKRTRGWGRTWVISFKFFQGDVFQGDFCNVGTMSGLGCSFPGHFGFLDLSNATDLNPLDVRISQNCTLQSTQLHMRHQKIIATEKTCNLTYLTNQHATNQVHPNSKNLQGCWEFQKPNIEADVFSTGWMSQNCGIDWIPGTWTMRWSRSWNLRRSRWMWRNGVAHCYSASRLDLIGSKRLSQWKNTGLI